jgi:hypothetical protein
MSKQAAILSRQDKTKTTRPMLVLPPRFETCCANSQQALQPATCVLHPFSRLSPSSPPPCPKPPGNDPPSSAARPEPTYSSVIATITAASALLATLVCSAQIAPATAGLLLRNWAMADRPAMSTSAMGVADAAIMVMLRTARMVLRVAVDRIG